MKFTAIFFSALVCAVAAAPAPAPQAAANGAGAAGAAAGAVNLQESTTIDPSVIQTTDDGQNPPVDGQSPALVSKNNFANFCLLGLPEVPITNGLQVKTESCNPTPIGNIPAQAKMPSGKFQSPKNGDTVPANVPFTITMAVKNIQTLNADGFIIGHTHFGINGAVDANGQVSAVVPPPGLPAGAYRLASIVSSSTHQPAIVPVAQHGLLDDAVYFTAVDGSAAAALAAVVAAAPAAAGAAGAAAGQQAAQGQATAGQAAPQRRR
ncbi:hypothetical protein C8J57DRAFT_1652088 [Mycena rebaudengoi]|nr:hypothetical protein C8J57DRAFT_1652088 [Mycena rebaudengoi]